MNYPHIAAEARKRYDAFAKTYRAIDATSTDEALRNHYSQNLSRLCQAFPKPITALDLGCGTGRYFQCLTQVEHLVGIDVSPEMLNQARQPVGQAHIRIPKIDLICANIFEHPFPEASFDLIYSIGVLGEYSPLDPAFCRKLYSWLKPGGKFFFTVVDAASKPINISLKRRAAEALFPLLLGNWKAKIRQERLWKSLYLTEPKLRTAIAEAGFKQFTISRFGVESNNGWVGAHFDCLIEKSVAQNRHPDNSKQQQGQSVLP